MAEPTNEPLATVAETETEQLPRTKEKLDELSQAASIHYATKNFPAAAENYANAVEIQAELNGEMAPENAELLFYYGRALYKVAVAKSDVLGNKVAQEEKKNKKPKAKKATKTDDSGEGSSARAPVPEKKEDGASDKGKGKAELSPRARTLKERIADCHGFLVEISLENERFHDAISDARAALTLQQELYPFEHENVTEAHYSLSLALEFASVSKVRQDQTGQSASAPEETDADAKQGKEDEDGVNWDLRNEAAEQTDLAIQSLEARLKKEEAALASDALTPEQKKEKQAIIKDKKGMLEDLKTRVADLKADPTKQAFDSIDPSVFQGILGGMLGADAVTQAAKIAEAKKNANDVSGMVKKKAKAPVVEEAKDVGGSKRKLEVDDDAADKRAKTEEPI
ncbi:SHNi-TPR domain-containing protein [Pyrenophora tritici-repentis]|nr:SHNi-TPR domain-containing protein [Pyrenophora tritici-repentis]KAI0606116.1 SHNi-TPR domain-containing protein [Pyrenophora tritici-repentis]